MSDAAKTFCVLEYAGNVNNDALLSENKLKRPSELENYLEITVTARAGVGTMSYTNIQKTVVNSKKIRQRNPWRYFFTSISQVMKDLFLPIDYPYSVESNYLQYQIYDSIQGLSSYLRGVVSTSAVLQVAGVGSSKADALSAAMAWATRDGIGMLGGLLFSYFASPLFDSYVKEFRLFADVINDLGLTLDMAAPLFPANQVIVVSCIATICKVMCGMAAGATKASITAHFAIRGNMADLSAKESSQETLMTLAGMSFGIILAKWLRSIGNVYKHSEFDQDSQKTEACIMWCVFSFLTILHIWANYQGMVLLKLKTLNEKRAKIALDRMVDHCSKKVLDAAVSTNNASSLSTSLLISPQEVEHMRLDMILSPNEVSESILPNLELMFKREINLGTKISEFFKNNHQTKDLSLFHLFWDEKYVLWILKQRVHVSLRWAAKQQDELKAYIHALIIQKCFDKMGDSFRMHSSLMLVSLTKSIVDAVYGDNSVFLNSLSHHGWDVSKLYLGFGKSRADWISKKC